MPILNSPIPDPDLLFYHDNPMTAGPTKKQFERLMEGKYNHDPPPPERKVGSDQTASTGEAPESTHDH